MYRAPMVDFDFARGVQLIDSNNDRFWLEQRDTTFMDEYSVQRSTTTDTGQPKYWANWDNNTLMLAPTPDQVYTIEMWYNETPERLSNTNTILYINNDA